MLLAVDADRATVGEAIATGAGLLLTHHPLLFRPVQSVAADTAKGALLHAMITGGSRTSPRTPTPTWRSTGSTTRSPTRWG